jgi:hypothetical protein
MGKYEIYKDDNRIDIFGYNQSFSMMDIKSLWEEHEILYLRNGVMAIWVEEREDRHPLIHLMQEDDGHIWWDKDKDVCFDSDWIDNYIKALSKVKDLIS